MSIFKACDIRGKYPDELDVETARKVGAALGTELGGGDFTVGGDVRPSTPELKDALIDGLTGSGSAVTDVGTAPTPAIYWAARSLQTAGTAIVTASHNPPGYNGIKFMLGKLPPSPDDVGRVRRRVEAMDFTGGTGSRRERVMREEYLDWLGEVFGGRSKGLRVLIDAGNGCASEWAPEAFRRAGAQVAELNCQPDGTFPNRSPNPSQRENLEQTGQKVREADVDFGAAFDGDGDRVVFLDEHGRVVQTDRAIVLLARAALENHPGGGVVYDIKCTDRVPEEVRRAGGIPLPERSGHAFIKTRLLREEAAFAGEASGHFFFAEIGGDDGLYAALAMARLLKNSGRCMSELAAAVPDYHITPDIRIPVEPGNAQEVIERVRETFSNRPQDDTDGVRVDFDDGWALVRPSVTEPVVTLRCEGDSDAALERIRERVEHAVQGQAGRE